MTASVDRFSTNGGTPGARGYPRPQLRRSRWTCLNGKWDFALDVDPAILLVSEVEFDRSIIVPFAPETVQSGINDSGFHRTCWYRRRVRVDSLPPTHRLVLHFGAVDYEATVFVDGRCVGHHQGGYTPFSFDITDWVRDQSEVELCVKVLDDPHDLAKPRGKQDWELEPHSIWYPRTTGIWQTVWMEQVPSTHISQIRWAPSLERWEFGLEVHVCGAESARALWLHVRLRARGNLLVEDRYRVVASEVHRFLALSDPGIDDFRNGLLWSPESPTLVQAELELTRDDGTVVDRVRSYTALRSVATERGRFVLNGRAYPMRLVLNQGYWPGTGITAPDDHALQRDVRLAKQMGFNGVRMHQKIEDPRYLYWADRLGLLVWAEMPSAYRFTKRSIERVAREWTSAVLRDISHPCIIVWVPFNESWGVANLPNSAAERHYVQGLYHLTRSLDPNRLVVGNDGWETTATDIVGIHDYDADPARIAKRYHLEGNPALLQRERPGGRLLVLEGHSANDAPLVLSEFGGIAFSPNPATWGYSKCQTQHEFVQQFAALMEVVNNLEMFTGYCYTQFSDTYQEANGLLYADRTPKMPVHLIASAVRASSLVPGAVGLHDSIPGEGSPSRFPPSARLPS